MAENKKSVLLYCDIIHTVEGLSDDEAGRLFKHYLRYINDLNPCSEDRLTALLFEPIKQNLKRDLKKWEAKSLKNKNNAKMRWHKENANASERTKDDANYADKVTVKDTVIVTDIVNDKVIKKIKDVALPLSDYQNCIDFWLKEFHQGWTFGGQQGKALKSLIKKIKKILTEAGKEVNEKSVFEAFKFMCLKLPEWHKTKDLPILDQKFNEIIEEIKSQKNGKQNKFANTVEAAINIASKRGWLPDNNTGEGNS